MEDMDRRLVLGLGLAASTLTLPITASAQTYDPNKGKEVDDIAMAGNPPREIQTLIDNNVNGFNTQNSELFLSVFGDTAIIIDGIAPYR